MNAETRVVITGLGVVSAVGTGWQDFWKNIVLGRSGISEVTTMDTSRHFTHRGGEVHDFDPERFIEPGKASRLSRATQLAVASTRLAVDDARLETKGRTDVGVCLGTTAGSTQVIERIHDLRHADPRQSDRPLQEQLPTVSTPSSVAHAFGTLGPALLISTACAAGNYAVGYGYDMVRLGKVRAVICGGFDSFSRISFTGFNQFGAVAPEKCQPFDLNRKGMMVAEGSGILILEALDHAVRRGAAVYGEVLGYGLSCDAHHMTNPVVDSIAECMKIALAASGVAPEDVDYISAHGTGTPANDRTECAAIRKVFGARYRQIPVSSIKSMLGHTMGAASAIEALTCALVVRHDIIPPTINFETPDPECDVDCVPNRAREQRVQIALNNSYAFGGNNASVVIRKFTG